MDETRRVDPRVERTRAAVVAAARELLLTEGRDAVTPSRVAELSGVGRATLYRHWPEPIALLLEAATPPAPLDVPATTGALTTDLIARLDALRRGLSSTPLAAVFSMVIERAEHEPELARLQRDLVESGSAPLRALLRDAVSRGSLSELDEDHVVETLVAPLFYRRFVARTPIPAHLPRQLVAEFLDHPRTQSEEQGPA